MILSPKIFMCQKSMGYENISMPKCMRKRKHAKEHDAYKKERKQWAHRCSPMRIR
jgi:hypothetical protein